MTENKTITFDFNRLVVRLGSFARSKKLLFSLLCSERLLPGYRKFQEVVDWGDSALLERCIHLGYEVITGEDAPVDIPKLIERCDRVIPDSEDFQGPLVNHAQNCGIAVTYSLDVLLSDKAEDAAYSAQKVVETVDSYLGMTLGLGSGAFDFADQQLIESHEFMQRELAKQRQDLAAIARISVPNQAVISQMRIVNREYTIPFVIADAT